MQLHEAYELIEVYRVEEANSLIQSEGWTLLAVVPGYDHRNGAASPCYVLGQPEPDEDPVAAPPVIVGVVKPRR